MTNYLLRNFDLLNEDPFYGVFNSKNTNVLRSDIKETDDNYIIDIEVPGISKNDISISFEDKNLTVKVSNKKQENVKYLHSERLTGTFSKSFYIGNVKQESIKASFDNGLLTISIDKNSVKEESTKFIEIN